ncbi:hypothetical protein, partial [Escherichia coli]|uniref:hypothetical protein n=1 Tax=Escherichia coli TaxID=562 RepID=UPI002281AF03
MRRRSSKGCIITLAVTFVSPEHSTPRPLTDKQLIVLIKSGTPLASVIQTLTSDKGRNMINSNTAPQGMAVTPHHLASES